MAVIFVCPTRGSNSNLPLLGGVSESRRSSGVISEKCKCDPSPTRISTNSVRDDVSQTTSSPSSSSSCEEPETDSQDAPKNSDQITEPVSDNASWNPNNTPASTAGSSETKKVAKGILKRTSTTKQQSVPRFRMLRRWLFRLILRSKRASQSAIFKTRFLASPTTTETDTWPGNPKSENRRDSEAKSVTISDSVCCLAYEVDSIELEERREHIKDIRSQRQTFRDEQVYCERFWFLNEEFRRDVI